MGSTVFPRSNAIIFLERLNEMALGGKAKRLSDRRAGVVRPAQDIGGGFHPFFLYISMNRHTG